MVNRKIKIMFSINPGILQTSPHHDSVLNLLDDFTFWVQKRKIGRTYSRPKRQSWRRRYFIDGRGNKIIYIV